MIQLHESVLPPIQQTVHGYSEGHCLLASSIRLPKDAERLVLLLSDLSGSTGGEPFDPYLTGYPILSAGYYALARTWPAPEMPRPGCVWTHTLLIRAEILGAMTQPTLLMQLFRRPSGSGFSAYQEEIPVPIGFQEKCMSIGEVCGIENSLAAGLLRAIYGSSDPRTVLTVPRYSIADSPLLSIWRLQWQGLRQRFTFCGGSRGPRSLEGEPFILQAALEKDLRRLDRGPTPPSVVPAGAETTVAGEEWVRVAAAACVDPASNALQTFIDRVGIELPADTTLFRPLVKAYIILGGFGTSDAAARLIELAAKEFPETGKGRDYKCAFLGAGSRAGLTESAIIRGLALTKQHEAFDAQMLDLQARSAALWADPEQAWELLRSLLAVGRSPLAGTVIHGLVSALPMSSLDLVLESTPGVIAEVIKRHPQLASSSKFWTSKPAHQRVAAALLECREAVVHIADEIIRSALNESADPVSPNLIEVFGPSAVRTVLAWADADQGRLSRLPPGWMTALAERKPQVVEWLRSSSSVRVELVTFALAVIGVESLCSNPSGMAAFAKHVPREGAAPQSLLTPLAGRLLRVSLASGMPDAIDLAAACLDPVYHAAAESRVPEDVWQELAPLLPDGHWWTWDRCYRLRTAIAEKFRSEQWPAAKLNDVTRDDAIFREIITHLKKRRSGRRVLAAAASGVNSRARREFMLSNPGEHQDEFVE